MLAIENSLASTPDMQWRHVSLAVAAGTREPARTAQKLLMGQGAQHASTDRSDCAAMPQKTPAIV